MRTMFVGDIVSGRPIIEAVQQHGDLVAVAIESDHQRAAAERFGVDLFFAGDVNSDSVLERLRELEPDLILNFNSRVIFRDRLLRFPRLGAINFHPGLLPDYAGLNVHQWAMLNGEKEAGVTLHLMSSGIDDGDIIAQERVQIELEETGLTLYMKLLRVGARLMACLLEELAETGFVNAREQELPHRYFYRAKDRPGGRIDFTQPMGRVARFIRALSYRPFTSPLGVPYIPTQCGVLELASISVAPFEAGGNPKPGTVLALDEGGISIACLDGQLIAKACYLEDERLVLGTDTQRLGLDIGQVV